MKKLLSIIFLTMTIISCSCDSTEPPITIDPPGRRDYVWNVDTLNYPFNPIYRIWGSSPNDVWAVSAGGDLDKTIFHFDGNSWTTDNVSRPISPHSIFGFAPNDVWIGGSNGKIWHFDGINWQEVAVLTKDGNTQIVFDNIWGESPNDFYAFGAYPDDRLLANNGVIAHYINSKWTMLNTEGFTGIVEHLYKNSTDKKLYLQVIKIGGGEHSDSTFIYEYSQVAVKKLYGSIWTKGKQADISLINGEVYFILGHEIAKRINNQFQTVLNVDNSNFYQRLWGKNSKDIFLMMTDGLVHYNGSDMEYLIYFDKARTQIYGAALFEKEVFFLVRESQFNLNLIYHGVLK